MGRKKQIEIEQEISTRVEIDFETALKVFKKVNSYKAYLMDKETVKIFIQKKLPEMKATQEEFNKLFKQF